MAHVDLNREQVRSILSLYHLDDLEEFGGMPDVATHTAYWVMVSGKRYFLRITEKKRVEDMIFEKELLSHLDRHGLPVPRLLKNVARGTFTPWSARGRFVSLFDYIGGRELGVFEVRPRHLRQLGHFSARMHSSVETFKRDRAPEQDLPALQTKLERLLRALERRRLAKRHGPQVQLLAGELHGQAKRRFDLIPSGVVHGALQVNNVRFVADRLTGVLDFESACRDRFIRDLATAISEWCWQPSPKQMGGPAGRFNVPRVRAFLTAYEKVRPLSPPERRALPAELRLVAAEGAILRLVNHELRRGSSGRAYRDYRHYTARLVALSNGAAESLVARGLQPAGAAEAGALQS